MPESAPSHRRRLIVVVATAVAVLALAEWGSSRLVSQEAADDSPTPGDRPNNVVAVSTTPADLPPAQDGPSVWLLGNSHAFIRCSEQRGQPWHVAPQGIAIDQLAERVNRQYPQTHTTFYLLGHPNFLPFEMLTRAGHLLIEGHRPTVVILGLTWRHIARDSQLRHDVFTTFHDPTFAAEFAKLLADPRVDADPEIIDEVDTQQARVAHDKEATRLRSDSDRLDEAITGWLGERVTLMKRSAGLRAQLLQSVNSRVQQWWFGQQSGDHSYELVEHDYEFNTKCLAALVRMLRAYGATVICYYTPERADMPLWMDPKRQNEFIDQFNRQAEPWGAIVLDARSVVPSACWGWAGELPDRSHFNEDGHRRLSDFLFLEADRRDVWKDLSRP